MSSVDISGVFLGLAVFFLAGFWCQRQESNLHPSLRRGLFYPLKYAGLIGNACFCNAVWPDRRESNPH